MKIGIFDSGVGGLTIFRAICHVLPEYNYIYLGDNLHIPYGEKDVETIYRLTQKAVSFLFQNDCEIVILACNTATAAALRRLQREYLPTHYPNRRILGVIRPVIEEVVDRQVKKVGIIATKTTVHSNSFVTEIHKCDPTIQVFQNPCPLLVPLIEQGKTDWAQLNPLLNSYLYPLLEHGIKTLVLGCTHYELISDKVKQVVGPTITVLTEGSITALKFKDYLTRHPEMETKLTKNYSRRYYVTNKTNHYEKLMKFFLKEALSESDPILSCDLSHF